MALQSIYNGMGFRLDSAMMWSTNAVTSNTMAAAGRSCAFIGKIYIDGAPASKTISSAGGKIAFRTGTCTFANAGTNFRVGIQDLASTGLEDGTFDVYADFTGGGGGIASNTPYEKAMTNGSKTLNHLGIYAICFETTARAGADSIIVQSYGNVDFFNSAVTEFPYRTVDTGAGVTRQSSAPYGAAIIFDDGTLGWIEGGWYCPDLTTGNISFNSGSTPDEYGAVFKVPFTCSVRGGYLNVGSISSTDTFEIILYSDATGTPVAERTVTVDPNYVGAAAAGPAQVLVSFDSFTLTAGSWYGLMLRPTSANTIQLQYHLLDSTFDCSKYLKQLPFGSNASLGARTNQTGAFTDPFEFNVDYPIFGLLIDKLDDGVSAAVANCTVSLG